MLVKPINNPQKAIPIKIIGYTQEITQETQYQLKTIGNTQEITQETQYQLKTIGNTQEITQETQYQLKTIGNTQAITQEIITQELCTKSTPRNKIGIKYKSTPIQSKSFYYPPPIERL